jgi:hypothetical protein
MSEWSEHPKRMIEALAIEALADEAERGYDVSGQPPTLPDVWVAELICPEGPGAGSVVARVLLTTREDADLALAGHWRVVRYVRADRAWIKGPGAA